MIPLQATALGLVALGGTAVVLTRDPLRQILVSGIFSLQLVALFVVFQAPDVALSAIGASGFALPLMVALALSRVRNQPVEEDDEE